MVVVYMIDALDLTYTYKHVVWPAQETEEEKKEWKRHLRCQKGSFATHASAYGTMHMGNMTSHMVIL